MVEILPFNILEVVDVCFDYTDHSEMTILF
jgi:hypothetical protein